ncbi:hypothetical protein BDV97DRAFT_365827 [Delphinella strobiligena]|nr:hypothetical protein BDV97DRAFT_365827 [Delphinella strobiligena]
MSNSVPDNRNPYTPLGPLLQRIKRLDERMKLIFQRQPTDVDWATIGYTILPRVPVVPFQDIEILTHLHAGSVALFSLEHHALLVYCARENSWPSEAHWQAMLSQDNRAWIVAKAAWSSYAIDLYDDSASYLSTLEKIERAAESWIARGAVWPAVNTH